MRKVFGMIALLLALAACNKAETDIPTKKPKAGATGKADGITITTTLAPKTAPTKAVSQGRKRSRHPHASRHGLFVEVAQSGRVEADVQGLRRQRRTMYRLEYGYWKCRRHSLAE